MAGRAAPAGRAALVGPTGLVAREAVEAPLAVEAAPARVESAVSGAPLDPEDLAPRAPATTKMI